MAVEPRRGCGYRKVGGMYLVCGGAGMPCDRLPYTLDVCPTCSHGIKQSRGWTWLDVAGLTGGNHAQCCDGFGFACPFCVPKIMQKSGLLWIGTQFYKTPDEFSQEATELGISRRISTIPRGFEVGKTWVLLAHPKTIRVGNCQTEGCDHNASIHTESGCKIAGCECDTPNFYKPAIFKIFRPSAIEKIITETQSKDAEFMDDLKKRGLTPVVVPDDDPDHRGSVFDKEGE